MKEIHIYDKNPMRISLLRNFVKETQGNVNWKYLENLEELSSVSGTLIVNLTADQWLNFSEIEKKLGKNKNAQIYIVNGIPSRNELKQELEKKYENIKMLQFNYRNSMKSYEILEEAVQHD